MAEYFSDEQLCIGYPGDASTDHVRLMKLFIAHCKKTDIVNEVIPVTNSTVPYDNDNTEFFDDKNTGRYELKCDAEMIDLFGRHREDKSWEWNMKQKWSLEICWERSYKWYKKAYRQEPFVDKESGKRREREE